MKLEGLTTRQLGQRLVYFDELTSTNAYAKEHAASLAHGTAIIARCQTNGRGRLGRSWLGDEDGLFLTVLLREEITENISNLQALPLVAGLSVLKALESVSGKGFSLKWSNDVLFGDKKLCGILCESRVEAGSAFIAVGIGVNLSGSREDFDLHGLVYATSLKLATGKKFDNLNVAACICNQFEPLLQKFYENGFEGLRQEYTESCRTVGSEVRVITSDGERDGIALGISGDGGLVCNIGGKTEIIRAGEAGVRGLYGYV